MRAPAGFAPLAIGLALTIIHLVSIPVTNTSVNPARSTGVAVFQGGWALGQLWAFWVAPLAGAALAAAESRRDVDGTLELGKSVCGESRPERRLHSGIRLVLTANHPAASASAAAM